VSSVHDPAVVPLVMSRLETVVREMMNTLLRTARSGVLNTARDFSCALLTADGRLVASADSLPIHVGSISLEAEAMLELHGGSLRPGDAFINNSPYDGGTHHADHTILVPIFVAGEHVMTACAKAHQADIGNSRPTTYLASAADVYEEGAVSLPCVRVQEGYADVEDIIRMCRVRIRVPDQWYGDYLGALGAARIGERGVQDVCERHGSETVRDVIDAWLAHTERKMIAEIAGLSSGTWTARTRHDPFPGVPDGITVDVSVSIDAPESRIVVDLRDNPDCVPCGLNLSEATARAAALIGVFSAIDPEIARNDGSIRRVSVLLRENCVVGIPRHPASCSVATTHLADRVANAVSRAMATARPGAGQAEGGLGIPASRAVISGSDPRRDGRRYVNQIFLGTAGGPATAACDGWMSYFTPVNNGMCRRDSVEVDEQKYPILVRRIELVPDSGGAGRYRGGLGTIVEFAPAGDATVTVAYSSDGHRFPAGGLHGGGPGGPARAFRIARDGTVTELPAVGEIELSPAETLRAVACGGGGYGDPLERERAAVERDVAEGYVTADAARDLYGRGGGAADDHRIE
jgi:N-methylhydantoinase B